MSRSDYSVTTQAGAPSGAASLRPVSLPARFLADAGVDGFLDAFGPDQIQGWITVLANPSPHVLIDVREGGNVIAQIVADQWRTDVQEGRQGDGRWGFETAVPAVLADGNTHDVTLTLPNGQMLLAGPVHVRFQSNTTQHSSPSANAIARTARPAWTGTLLPGQLLISIIIVFYNMKREAQRTLTSLSRTYQENTDGIDYEVMCIDNGSAEPLSAEWVASFGPEFRLFRPQRILPSPISAMNEAARAARGHHVALMIDGAHLLSPGVLREAAEAIRESPGVVVGLRQWFVGGDQRFLATAGWRREQEDILFDRAGWPNDGYAMFGISAPVWESPNHWFDGMSESNCLFVPARTFAQIGGFDESFDESGAGFANLDLFRRAVDASAEPPVALIGEASFHQFHDGTTTNVDEDEKERRVRAYEYKYTCLRGQSWVPIDPTAIRLRGQMRTMSAMMSRQRPLSPAQVGATTQIRAAVLPTHFDYLAEYYLVSVYAEAGLKNNVKWSDAVLGVAPPDAFAMASILHEIQPARVIAINLPAGLLTFLRNAVHSNGGATRFVVVGDGGIGLSETDDLSDPAIVGAVRRAIGAAIDVVVLYQPRPQDRSLLAVLQTYSSFVSLRSYLVCLDTASGQPWLGYSVNWTKNAVTLFAAASSFAIDHTRTGHFITSCPHGFLQRIGPVTVAESAQSLQLVGSS